MFTWWFRTLVIMSITMEFGHKSAAHSEDDWIDPSDMVNYDSSSMRMISKQEKKEVKDKNECGDENFIPIGTYQMVKDQLELCAKEKEVLANEKETEDACVGKVEDSSNEGAFFRQYIKSIILNFDNDGGSYQMQVTLTKAHMAALVSFSSSHGRVEDAHEVLTSMVDYVIELDGPNHLTRLERFENFIGMDIFSVFKIMATVMMGAFTCKLLVGMHPASWAQITTRLFMAVFLTSVPWNWFHLYKKALAKNHAELLKERPSACNPESRSATQSIFQWVASAFTFSTDECAKYHERLLIDPMWEVPPTQALAVTLTKFFLEPLRHLGEAFSALIKGLLKDLPVHLWPVAIGVFLFLTIFVLLLVCGYRIKLLWNIFGLEPVYRPQPRENMMPPERLDAQKPVPAIQNLPQHQPQPLPPVNIRNDNIENNPRLNDPMPVIQNIPRRDNIEDNWVVIPEVPEVVGPENEVMSDNEEQAENTEVGLDNVPITSELVIHDEIRHVSEPQNNTPVVPASPASGNNGNANNQNTDDTVEEDLPLNVTVPNSNIELESSSSLGNHEIVSSYEEPTVQPPVEEVGLS